MKKWSLQVIIIYLIIIALISCVDSKKNEPIPNNSSIYQGPFTLEIIGTSSDDKAAAYVNSGETISIIYQTRSQNGITFINALIDSGLASGILSKNEYPKVFTGSVYDYVASIIIKPGDSLNRLNRLKILVRDQKGDEKEVYFRFKVKSITSTKPTITFENGSKNQKDTIKISNEGLSKLNNYLYIKNAVMNLTLKVYIKNATDSIYTLNSSDNIGFDSKETYSSFDIYDYEKVEGKTTRFMVIASNRYNESDTVFYSIYVSAPSFTVSNKTIGSQNDIVYARYVTFYQYTNYSSNISTYKKRTLSATDIGLINFVTAYYSGKNYFFSLQEYIKQEYNFTDTIKTLIASNYYSSPTPTFFSNSGITNIQFDTLSISYADNLISKATFTNQKIALMKDSVYFIRANNNSNNALSNPYKYAIIKINEIYGTEDGYVNFDIKTR